MKNLTWWTIALLLVVAGFAQSCGTRKVANDINKQSEQTKETSKTTDSQTSTTENKKETVESEKVDKVDEKQEQKITELYFQNGVLKKRITELNNSKSTDKTVKDKKSLETLKIYQTHYVNSETQKTRTVTKFVKQKTTESSNAKWVWMVGWVFVVLILVYFAYRYFKKI